MNVFAVANKHVGFRNIVAHSPLIITGHEDGSKHIQGILNLTPNDDKKAGELVSLIELRWTCDESANMGNQLLQMQGDYQNTSAA